MRHSEFQRAVLNEFGRYGDVIVADLALTTLGGRTAQVALHDGFSPRDVWLALCEASDVPESRRHGAGLQTPER